MQRRGGELGKGATKAATGVAFFVRVALVFVSLGATLGGIWVTSREEGRRVTREIETTTADSRRRLVAVVESELAAFAIKGHNAGSTPRLLAALNGGVGVETLRDLFETESWWQPFRQEFPTIHVVPPGEGASFVVGVSDRPPAAAALIDRVRRSGEAAARVVPGPGGAVSVVAVPVHLPRAGAPTVLLLSRPFDAAALAALGARADMALLLTDGDRVLLGTGASSDTSQLKAAVGSEARGDVFAPEPELFSAVVVEAGPGLWLLGHVDTASAAARASGTFAALKLGVGGTGGVLFVVALVSLLRARAPRARRGQGFEDTMIAPTPAHGLPSSTIGRYVLLEKLGSGGMADVHLAVSLGESGFRRPCVVKRLRPELADNPMAVAQFTDEATLASSLVHSNIVPIYDFGRVGGQHFLVQEYIAGRDVGRLVRRLAEAGKKLPPAAVAKVGVDVLQALDYAHHKARPDGQAMGIVHRDVSPENIMVSLRGEVKLLDFGVMKARDGRVSRTDFGTLKGNLAFMAPEQARGEDVDGRADLFAVALVLYFCLQGEPLYGALGGYDLLAKASVGPGPTEQAKIAALPAPFGTSLQRALAPSRDVRYANAALFAADLSAWANDGGGRLTTLANDLFEAEIRNEQRQLATPSSTFGPGEATHATAEVAS